jgi:outer membrane biosynthesis protein TonB
MSALFIGSSVFTASAATPNTPPVQPKPQTVTPTKKTEKKKAEEKKVEVKKPEIKKEEKKTVPVSPPVKKVETKKPEVKPTPKVTPKKETPKTTTVGNRTYITGPRGGCYYNNASGNKVYVDHSFCKK